MSVAKFLRLLALNFFFGGVQNERSEIFAFAALISFRRGTKISLGFTPLIFALLRKYK